MTGEMLTDDSTSCLPKCRLARVVCHATGHFPAARFLAAPRWIPRGVCDEPRGGAAAPHGAWEARPDFVVQVRYLIVQSNSIPFNSLTCLVQFILSCLQFFAMYSHLFVLPDCRLLQLEPAVASRCKAEMCKNQGLRGIFRPQMPQLCSRGSAAAISLSIHIVSWT